jgi:hypothetical protein
MTIGRSPRIVLRIKDAGNGALHGSISFIARAADALALLSTTYRAPDLAAAIGEITFRGKVSADGKSIAGTWTQGNQYFPVSQQKAPFAGTDLPSDELVCCSAIITIDS